MYINKYGREIRWDVSVCSSSVHILQQSCMLRGRCLFFVCSFILSVCVSCSLSHQKLFLSSWSALTNFLRCIIHAHTHAHTLTLGFFLATSLLSFHLRIHVLFALAYFSITSIILFGMWELTQDTYIYDTRAAASFSTNFVSKPPPPPLLLLTHFPLHIEIQHPLILSHSVSPYTHHIRLPPKNFMLLFVFHGPFNIK